MFAKTLKNKAVSIFLILILLISLPGCSFQQESKEKVLTVTLLKVGKADAVVVLSDNHALLIDTGEEDDGEEVVEYLRNNGISKIDDMIITHFDQDHVGGADTVLEKLNVDNIYIPDYEGTHTEYTDFIAAVNQSSATVNRLTTSISLSFADATILIDPPKSYDITNPDSDYDNNFSLITTIIHGNNRLVFTGDAEKQRIREWMNSENAVKCNFLKVPHHGIYNRALKDLFKTLNPDISVICSSNKNPADEKTLTLLHSYCPSVYETKDGNVMIISDGKKLESSQRRKH